MGSIVGSAKRIVVALAAMGAATFASSSADAAVGFCTFGDQGQVLGVQTNGDAELVGVGLGGLLSLTSNSPNKTGSAWLKTPITVTPGSQIRTHFRFRMYPNTAGTGGSGITFTIQNKSLTALGGSGGGLGINGVNNSVSVELDALKDNNNDLDNNHVAILEGGKTGQPLKSATAPVAMKNGVLTDVWIDYDGATMSVFMGQGVPKPATPFLTHTLNVYNLVNAAANGNKAFVGFTGSTSNTESNNQDVSYWVLTDDGTPPTDCITCVNDGDCAVVPLTPACQPNNFCGECSATNATRCVGARPVCNVDNGVCVECNTDAQCSGNRPVCDNHVCVACANDFGGAAPACQQATKPACQKAAPLVGACTQCSATNASLCAMPTPVCVTSVGVCGCVTDADCGGALSGLICKGTPGACVPGCRVDGNGGTCPVGQACQPVQGNEGKCIVGCVGAGDCKEPIPVCDPDSNNCVQCTVNTDCQNNQVCTPQNTCGECSPTNNDNCKPEDKGDECKPNGQCGCVDDGDCGGVNSGRVCDDTQKVCRAGCRGTGGNKCPTGQRCTSTNNVIGQCVTDTDGGADGGTDAGTDAGKDAGNDGGDAGTKPDSGNVGTDSGTGGGADSGAVIDDLGSIEGGGCSCNTLGSSSGMPLGAFAVSGLALLALARRRRR